MDFDIHQLDRVSREDDEDREAFEEFQQALMERFVESPEGQQRLQADPGMGFWVARLLYFGYDYEGLSVTKMTVPDIRRIVCELFPRKISLHSAEDADDAVPELIAFWQYLQREFRLPQAATILRYLREIEPELPRIMNDPANFGMAKSFFMLGQSSGFDMTSQAGNNAFVAAYNLSRLAAMTPPAQPIVAAYLPEPWAHPDAAARKAAKKRRKQATEARKRNRKKRK